MQDEKCCRIVEFILNHASRGICSALQGVLIFLADNFKPPIDDDDEKNALPSSDKLMSILLLCNKSTVTYNNAMIPPAITVDDV